MIEADSVDCDCAERGQARALAVLPSREYLQVAKKRVLVVDDEASVTRVLVEFLEKTGLYEVMAVNEPETAMDAARRFLPDLFILDIIMTSIDGGELLTALNEIEGLVDTPAIFVTGALSKSEAGANGYHLAGQPVIAKPVQLETFRALVAKQLALAS
mgnify:CR=1 FL=1